MENLKLNQKKVSESFFTDRYLNNEGYFSRGNKRFFNVKKTECFEIGEFFGAVIEEQGEFLPNSGNNHTVLKLVSHDRNITTVTSGFNGTRNGRALYKEIISFLKTRLGNFEKNIISKLESIKLAADYKDSLLFEDFNGNGFYLYFGKSNYTELKILTHKKVW